MATKLKIPEQIATCGYDVIEREGYGTYGSVYKVSDSNNNIFALKYVNNHDGYDEVGLVELNEIDILSRVHHPHIIHALKLLTRCDCQINNLAIVLPLADQTLANLTWFRRETTEFKLPILYKLATALEFMHRSNILYLDIKSTNVVLKDDHPYFIDFGTSRVVPDINHGFDSFDNLVTINHRAPELFINLPTMRHNASIDIWAFGIMMLYVLSEQHVFNVNFDKITPEDFSKYQIKLFSDINTIPKLLKCVSDKYRDLSIDLIRNLLSFDPHKRLTAQQLVTHPLFDSVRTAINGFLTIPSINYDYAPDYKDNLRLMITAITSIYPTKSAQMLFLAVDLLARTSSHFKEEPEDKRKILVATCVWMADKIINMYPISLPGYVLKVRILIPQVTSKEILDTELKIVRVLEGVLNVSVLYTACNNVDELKLSFTNVILADDPTLYARLDIVSWKGIMKETIKYTTLSKEISIKGLIL